MPNRLSVLCGIISFSFELKRIKFRAGSQNSYIFVFMVADEDKVESFVDDV